MFVATNFWLQMSFRIQDDIVPQADHNPVLIGLTAAALALAALFACLIPARRAALVDPAQALRTE